MVTTPTIRIMQPSDLELALDWAAQEGWNPGLQDAIAFYAADPSGFLIAELDGEPIGSISAVRYGNQFGFIGLYIVRSQWRGRGYGMQLWEAALRQLTARMDGDQPCIGVDGVLDREADYEQSGFKAVYRHVRYVYEPAASDGISEAVIPLAEVPLEAIAGYEAALFPASRELFLHPWIQLAGAAYGAMEQGRLTGYGVLRPCRQGFKIGPLFADSIEIADRLFLALTHRCVGQSVFIDIPTINPSFSNFVERYGLQPVFTCVRMYRGCKPRLDVERIFGITTLELG